MNSKVRSLSDADISSERRVSRRSLLGIGAGLGAAAVFGPTPGEAAVVDRMTGDVYLPFPNFTMVHTPTDLVLYGPFVEETAKKIAANGVVVKTARITGPHGHINGVFAIHQAAGEIRAFLGQ
jgi:hypothetical protein